MYYNLYQKLFFNSSCTKPTRTTLSLIFLYRTIETDLFISEVEKSASQYRIWRQANVLRYVYKHGIYHTYSRCTSELYFKTDVLTYRTLAFDAHKGTFTVVNERIRYIDMTNVHTCKPKTPLGTVRSPSELFGWTSNGERVICTIEPNLANSFPGNRVVRPHSRPYWWKVGAGSKGKGGNRRLQIIK